MHSHQQPVAVRLSSHISLQDTFDPRNCLGVCDVPGFLARNRELASRCNACGVCINVTLRWMLRACRHVNNPARRQRRATRLAGASVAKSQTLPPDAWLGRYLPYILLLEVARMGGWVWRGVAHRASLRVLVLTHGMHACGHHAWELQHAHLIGQTTLISTFRE